jgi:hypothetical protein
MPFKSTEAKAEYNRLYYQKNKLRINVERIVKDIKNNEQRCVRPSTLLKYDKAIDDNQLTFLTDLVKKCKDERKVLYEMPLPQPIVEASIPIPNPTIPFVPRLPITKTFKKNTDPNTFTIDEAKLVIHSTRTKDNSTTETTYISKLNVIMKKFNLSKVDGIFSNVYELGYDKIVEVLSSYETPSASICCNVSNDI